MDDLATALLEYRLTSLKNGDTEAECTENPTPVVGVDINIPIIDIISKSPSRRIHFDPDIHPIVTMLNAGILATTPTNPQYGISINTLYFYHRLRLRKPSFSVQAFSKFVCDLYRIPYERRYRDMISRSFEIYVRLDSIIENHVKKAC